MIPEFPKWKSLDFSDREEVEKIVSVFSPYSDFNFFSMWCWDVKGEMQVSKLNGNLVVLFNDYLTGEPFISFIGKEKIKETAKALIEYSKVNFNKGHLKLIPEDVAFLFGGDKDFEIIPDRDAFDYVYEVEHIANMHNWPQHSSGKNVRRILKDNLDYNIEHFDLSGIQSNKFLALFEQWVKSKNLGHYEDVSEYNAFEKILSSKSKDLFAVGLCVEKELVGFTVYQICSSEDAISHFAKADKTFLKEATDLLNWEEAKILKEQGIKHFNWEQDLGIKGLRMSKEKYQPKKMLYKFIVKLRE